MKFDPALAVLLALPLSNGACRGYAMETCGFSPEAIQRVVGELHYVFDMRGLEEAEQHYQNSPY